MRDKIAAELKKAMKAKDKTRVSTLRLILAAIKDRDIQARSVGKERVDDDTILKLLAKMIRQRRESVKVYEEAGRLELAQQEQDEINIISEFLPAQLDDAEMTAAIDEAIAAQEASGLKDMGRVMNHLKQNYAGRMDFAKVGKLVKQKLAA